MERDNRQMELSEMYNVFIVEMDEEKDKDVYALIRLGIDLEFDIYDYFNGIMEIKRKAGDVVYRNRIFKLADVWTELEKRRKLLYNWIEENTGLNLGLEPRGYGDE